MWFIFALLSAVFASFRKVNDKHLSHTVHHLHLAWMTKLAALPVIGVTAILTHQLTPDFSLTPVFWVCILVGACITTPLDTAVYLHSLKHGQLSKTAPLMSLWPVVMLISGAIFLGQIPSLSAICAVLVIVAGIFILNTRKGSLNIFKNIWSDRGTRYGLIGVGTVSINTTLGAIGVAHSAPLFFSFWAGICSIIAQFTFAQLIAPGLFRHPHIKLVGQNGVIQGFANTLYFNALAVGPVGYVTAVRSLSATISAVIGAKVFKEGLTSRKIIALSTIAIGVALLGLAA